MKYNQVLEDIIMRPTHKFVYGSLEERSEYFKNLAAIYCFDSKEKAPVGVYIDDEGLETCKNKDCDKNKIEFFNSRYFEINTMYHILDKLIKELPKDILKKIVKDVLRPFNYTVKNTFSSLEELRDELLKVKKIYLKEYKHYIETGKLNDFIDELRVFMILIDLTLDNLKRVIPNLSYMSLLIKKEHDYSSIYTQVINFYIGARSNGTLNINIGCSNPSEWPTLIDLNGNCIQYIHDYDAVNMNDFILKRNSKK